MKNFKSRWTFFINNYRLTYIIVALVAILGFMAILNMPKESSPEVDMPIVVVTTALPGASAIDVEELVTNEIESKLQSLPDVDSITSTSGQGISSVVVNFNINSEGSEKLSSVRDRVSQLKSELPSDATDPVATQISFSDVPILNFAIGGPYQTGELNQYAEKLKADIERIANVSKVEIVGSPEKEIKVLIKQNKLDQFGLSLSAVTNAISMANSDIPIGSIETANEVFTVRFNGRLNNKDEVENIAVTGQGGNFVLIKDIANVALGYSPQSTILRLSESGSVASPSVSIQVFKASGKGNILDISDETKQIIENAKKSYLPEETVVTVVSDDASYIRTDLRNLVLSGLFTMTIILIVLTLFLGIREALLASIAVPLTFLFTFIFLDLFGYSINFLTLFSLILALGILVDGAIVITEGIFSNLKKGMSAKDSAIETIHEFEMPLISGTLTTIFVFLPLLMMGGIIGKFIESIPVTITIVLLSSIAIALGIITTVSVNVLKNRAIDSAHNGKIHGVIDWIYEKYETALSRLNSSGRYGKRLLWIMVLLFVMAMSLPVIGVLKVNMFPADDLDFIYVDIEGPIGTTLLETDSILKKIEENLYEKDVIMSFQTTAGSSSMMSGSFSSTKNSHVGSIIVNLDPDRDVDSGKIASELERELRGVVDVDLRVTQLQGGPEQGSPISINIIGDDFEKSEETAIAISRILKNIDGTKNINEGVSNSNGEFIINIDRRKAELYGVNSIQVAGILRNAISGTDATVIKDNGEDIDVVVKILFDQTDVNTGIEYGASKIDIPSINNITVKTQRGNVPIASFADITFGNSRSSISHKDGDRIVTVTSGVLDGYNTRSILLKAQEEINKLSIPDGIEVTYGGEAEDIGDSFKDLGRAMILGIFSIFALLVWQFKSWRQPLFILATIPLAMIGVLPGLALTGQPFSFPGFIGVVALAGIVVNNAIILIDSINNNRRIGGMSKRQAVESSAKSRLQPILLTTITTVSGMIPLAFSSPTWAPIAYSIIFGLSFSAVLTLFVVPTLYLLFAEKDLNKDEE